MRPSARRMATTLQAALVDLRVRVGLKALAISRYGAAVRGAVPTWTKAKIENRRPAYRFLA